MKRYAVIMAGGVGARFWPASRKASPKQLLALGPNPKRSLLRSTADRLSSIVPRENILIVTGRHLASATREALDSIPAQNILQEPVGRNTAPCIAWATAEIRRRSPNATIGVFPADHHIGDEASYTSVIERAFDLATEPHIVTVGITPTRPETGYGYIEAGASLSAQQTSFEVARFVEKPDVEKAKQYIEAGNFYWNSGMFFFSEATMWRALERHAPEIAKTAAQIAAEEDGKTRVLDELFPTMESVSIDYAVMERVQGVRVVTGDFGWSDLGSWQTAWELAPKDEHDNAAPSDSVMMNSKGCLLRAPEGKTVALLGCKDLVVVDTGDALLVAPREEAQRVRDIVDALKAQGSDRL